MHQMLQYFDRLMPQGEIDSQSPFASQTQEYIHKIGEKIRSRVVFVTMLPQIMSTIYLLVWRSSDIVPE
ncbi:2796_t:CDS:1, partial [Racocetra persica]